MLLIRKTKNMKKILLTLAIAFGLTQITKAQTITCIPCDQLSMTVNVSDTNYLNIYHAGQYLTHPQEFNVFVWEFTDQQGNIIFEDTIVNDAIVRKTNNCIIHYCIFKYYIALLVCKFPRKNIKFLRIG